MALSHTHVFKREYVAEVTEIMGNMLTVSIVWPIGRGYTLLKDTITTTLQWRIFPFPSFVGYKRVLAAFKGLRHMYSHAQALFEQIVGSFVVDDVGECTRSSRDCDQVAECAKTDGQTAEGVKDQFVGENEIPETGNFAVLLFLEIFYLLL